MIITKRAGVDSELEGVLQLQGRNLRRNIGDAEAAEQGFLIAEYSLEYLRRLNESRPSIIAVDGDRVVGYALVVTREIGEQDPFLAELFQQIDQREFEGEPLRAAKYVVVGQLCVDRQYRGLGLVQQLYGLFRDSLREHYRYGITEVARANRRSLRAHRKTGFQVIDSFDSGGLEWDLVLWDWTNGKSATRGPAGPAQMRP